MDPLDELTQVQTPKTVSQWRTEEAYIYDAVGNRVTDKTQHLYQYDAANRLTTGGHFTYVYDAEDRLLDVVTPKTEVTFRYDPLGRRTEKRVIRWADEDMDGTPDPTEEQPPRVTRYVYNGQALLATFTETGKERARYTHGPGIDEPLAELHRQQLTFYQSDALGSILTLTDAEAAFRIQKSDLGLRPIWHQRPDQVQAHILVCFLAYVLWKTLDQWQRRAGQGQSPHTVLATLHRIQSAKLVVPTADGRELRLRCVVRPDPDQAVLLDRLGLELPQRLRIRPELARLVHM